MWRRWKIFKRTVKKNEPFDHSFPSKSRKIPALVPARVNTREKLNGFKITSTILAFMSLSKLPIPDQVSSLRRQR